jgi:hypothetical protein
MKGDPLPGFEPMLHHFSREAQFPGSAPREDSMMKSGLGRKLGVASIGHP